MLAHLKRVKHVTVLKSAEKRSNKSSFWDDLVLTSSESSCHSALWDQGSPDSLIPQLLFRVLVTSHSPPLPRKTRTIPNVPLTPRPPRTRSSGQTVEFVHGVTPFSVSAQKITTMEVVRPSLVRHFVFRTWTNQRKSEELWSLLPLTFQLQYPIF